jgi:nicotinamidase/pyrazinamidase
MNKALLLIDIQNCFIPGGTLAVPHGDEVIPEANKLQQQFEHVIATQDWHPAGHKSFAVNHPGHHVYERVDLDGLEQVLWPAHAIQNTVDADFAPGLDRAKWGKVIRKGMNPDIDSYSAFFDNGHKLKTELDDYLKAQQITDIHVVGLATDYCVKFSVLDALELGYQVVVHRNACRGVNLNPEDSERALQEMEQAGAVIVD